MPMAVVMMTMANMGLALLRLGPESDDSVCIDVDRWMRETERIRIGNGMETTEAVGVGGACC